MFASVYSLTTHQTTAITLLSNYFPVAASWSGLCVAFCCSLYYSHTVMFSCAVCRKILPYFSVWFTRTRRLLVLIFAAYFCYYFFFPSRTTVPPSHSASHHSQSFPFLLKPYSLRPTANFCMSSSTCRMYSVQLPSLPLNLYKVQDKFNCCWMNFISSVCVFVGLCVTFCSCVRNRVLN
jgi:hypothetical protein